MLAVFRNWQLATAAGLHRNATRDHVAQPATEGAAPRWEGGSASPAASPPHARSSWLCWQRLAAPESRQRWAAARRAVGGSREMC